MLLTGAVNSPVLILHFSFVMMIVDFDARTSEMSSKTAQLLDFFFPLDENHSEVHMLFSRCFERR